MLLLSLFNDDIPETVQVFIVVLLMLITSQSSITTQRLHNFTFTLVDKAITALPGCYLVHRILFSNFVHMLTLSLLSDHGR